MDKRQPNKVREKKPRNKNSKKRLVFIIGLTLVLVGAAIGGYLFINKKSIISNSDKLVISVSESTKTASKQAAKLINSGDNAAAVKVYDQAVKDIDNDDEKITLLISKASLYYNDGDIENALAAMKAALAIKETVGVDDYLARLYYENGDLEDAIKYYQKAMELLEKTSVTYKSDQADYQSIINEIKSEAGDE